MCHYHQLHFSTLLTGDCRKRVAQRNPICSSRISALSYIRRNLITFVCVHRHACVYVPYIQVEFRGQLTEVSSISIMYVRGSHTGMLEGVPFCWFYLQLFLEMYFHWSFLSIKTNTKQITEKELTSLRLMVHSPSLNVHIC